MTVEELAILIAQLSPEHREELKKLVSEAMNAHVQSKSCLFRSRGHTSLAA